MRTGIIQMENLKWAPPYGDRVTQLTETLAKNSARILVLEDYLARIHPANDESFGCQAEINSLRMANSKMRRHIAEMAVKA